MVDFILTMPEDTKLMATAPIVSNRKGNSRIYLETSRRKALLDFGFALVVEQPIQQKQKFMKWITYQA
jgi:hypothetical protein